MPLYEVGLEDGRRLRIDADSNTAAAAGAAHWLKANPLDSGFLSSVQAGAANAVAGAGQSLKYLGADQLGSSLESAGRSMEPEHYQPANAEIKQPRTDEYKLSDIPYVGSYLPDWGARGIGRSIVEGAPGFAADLTGARLGASLGGALGALGGPVAPVTVPAGAVLGGLAGGVGAHFLQTYGPSAKETAVKRTGDESAEPTTQDKLVGGGTAALESALQALPVGKVLGGAAKAVGARGVAQAARNAAEATGAGAVAGMGQSALHQAGTSLTAPGGPSVDPEDVGIAGLTGGLTAGIARTPKSVINEAFQALRMGDQGGAVAPGATQLANRIMEKVGGNPEELSRLHAQSIPTGKDSGAHGSYKAVSDAIKDVHSDLADALKGVDVSSEPARRALDRAKTGAPLREHDFTALEEGLAGLPEGPKIISLAREATAAAHLQDKGNLNDKAQTFTGGLSTTLRDYAKRHAWVAATAIGGAGTAGALLGTAGLGAAAATVPLGAYWALHKLNRMNGSYFPARTYVDKFADPSVARPQVPEPAPEPPPSRPGPTGPGIKPLPTPWGAEAPDPAAGAHVKTAEALLKQLAARAKWERKQQESSRRAETAARRETRQDEAWSMRKEDRQLRLDDRQLRLEDRQMRRDLLQKRLDAQERAEQERLRGEALADNLGAQSALISGSGGLDVVGVPGFGERARRLLSAANAYRRLTSDPAEEAPPVAKRRRAKASPPPEAGADTAPSPEPSAAAPAAEAYAPSLSGYQHMTPAEAAVHITERAVDAGGLKTPSARNMYQRATEERQTALYQVADALAELMPGLVDAPTIRGWMQAERNRSDARVLRDHIRSLLPESDQPAVDTIMSNEAINAIWKKEGKAGRPAASTRPAPAPKPEPPSTMEDVPFPDAPSAPAVPDQLVRAASAKQKIAKHQGTVTVKPYVPEAPGAKVDPAAIRSAYDQLASEQGGFSTVKIADLQQRTGLPKDVLNPWLLEQAKAGNVTIHPTTSVELPKAVIDAGIRIPGHADPYVTVVFPEKQVPPTPAVKEAPKMNDDGLDIPDFLRRTPPPKTDRR